MLQMQPLPQPLLQRLLGVWFVSLSKPCRWRGDVCELCVSLAKSFPSGSFLFPPERTEALGRQLAMPDPPLKRQIFPLL